MIRCLISMASLVTLLFAGAAGVAHAQAAGDSAKPVVVLQVKSIDQLVASVNAMAKNFLPEPMLKEAMREFLGKLDPKLVAGVNPKLPIALYANLGDGAAKGDFSKGSVVILIPVANETAFIETLGKYGLKLEKNRDEYAVPIPGAPAPATMRIRKGYAHISIATAKVAEAALLQPGEIISGKETAAAVLHIHMDRVPEATRKQFLESFTKEMKQKVDQAKKAIGNTDGAATPELVRYHSARLTERWLAAWITSLVNDCKEMAIRVDLDPKSGVLRTDVSVEPRHGSELAKSIADLQPTKNSFVDIVGKDSAIHALVKAPLFVNGFRDLMRLLNQTVTTQLKDKDSAGAEAFLEVSKALGRTVDDGKLDLALSLRGPDADGKCTAIGAFTLKDTAPVEKALKALVSSAPKKDVEMIKLDAFTVKGANVHEITVRKWLPPDAMKVFGTNPVYVSLAPEACFVTFGPQGKDLIKQALSQKLTPKAAPCVQLELSGKRMGVLFRTLGAPQDALQFIDKLTAERSTVLSLDVQGGKKLVVRAEVGLPALFIVAPKVKKAPSAP